MFETLHELLNIPRDKVCNVSHGERKQLNGNSNYFSDDGFHPGTAGAQYWCDKVLFPMLRSKNIL
jgi:lysophospholipase L1-like esterase